MGFKTAVQLYLQKKKSVRIWNLGVGVSSKPKGLENSYKNPQDEKSESWNERLCSAIKSSSQFPNNYSAARVGINHQFSPISHLRKCKRTTMDQNLRSIHRAALAAVSEEFGTMPSPERS